MHRRRNKNSYKTKWRNFVSLKSECVNLDVHLGDHRKMREKIGQLIAGLKYPYLPLVLCQVDN